MTARAHATAGPPQRGTRPSTWTSSPPDTSSDMQTIRCPRNRVKLKVEQSDRSLLACRSRRDDRIVLVAEAMESRVVDALIRPSSTYLGSRFSSQIADLNGFPKGEP